MADRDLGALRFTIVGDASGVSKTFQTAGAEIRSQFADLGRNLAAAFTVGALVNGIEGAAQFANATRDAAEAAGVGVEKYQALSIAAKDAGSSQEKLTQALYVLAQSRAAMQAGGDAGEAMAASFRKLGLSAADIVSLAPEQVLERIGAKLADGSSGAAEFNAALDVMGARVGPAFIAALKEIGSQGLDGLTSKLRESGRIMDEEMTKQLDRAQKSLEAFEQRRTVFYGAVAQGTMDLGRLLGAMFEPGNSRTLSEAAAKMIQEDIARATAERAGASGGSRADTVGDAAQREIEATDQAMQKLENSRLSKVQQLAKLEREIADLRQRSVESMDQVESARLQRIAAEKSLAAEPLRRQVNDEQARAESESRRRLGSMFQTQLRAQFSLQEALAGIAPGGIRPANALASMGGFIGGQSDPMMRIAERQLRTLDAIEKVAREMAQRLALAGSSDGEQEGFI